MSMTVSNGFRAKIVIFLVGIAISVLLLSCSSHSNLEAYKEKIDFNPTSADACTTELDGSQCCNAGDNSFCTGGPSSIACNFLSDSCLGGNYLEDSLGRGGICVGASPCKTE